MRPPLERRTATTTQPQRVLYKYCIVYHSRESRESSARAAEKAAAKQEREEAGEEDAEELYKTRAMDDYKDTHTKGAGNRYNRT